MRDEGTMHVLASSGGTEAAAALPPAAAADLPAEGVGLTPSNPVPASSVACREMVMLERSTATSVFAGHLKKIQK